MYTFNGGSDTQSNQSHSTSAEDQAAIYVGGGGMLTLADAMQCTTLLHITAITFIDDDESGLHRHYQVWLGEPALHAPIDQARPEAGCTTARARTMQART